MDQQPILIVGESFCLWRSQSQTFLGLHLFLRYILQMLEFLQASSQKNDGNQEKLRS